jgi:hypothetical protein
MLVFIEEELKRYSDACPLEILKWQPDRKFLKNSNFPTTKNNN